MRSSPLRETFFAFSSFGVKVGIHVNRPNALDGLLPYLPVGWKLTSPENLGRTYSLQLDRGKAGVAEHLLYRDRKKVASTTEEQALLETFESHVAIHVADRSLEGVFVHAGVVGWRGHAIVIPGRSYSGKTTLVAAFVRAGAVYYSDEYAIFDRHGQVHPYSRDLHIRKAGERRQTKWAAEKLGGVVGSTALPLGLVLATRYREDARWRPRQISAGQGIFELLKNTVSVRRAPDAALSAFQSAIQQAKILRGVRGDADEVVAWVLREMV